MIFNYLKSLIISRTKRAFEVKQKTFFLVLQVISFRHTKQISKNVADPIFKVKGSKRKRHKGCKLVDITTRIDFKLVQFKPKFSLHKNGLICTFIVSIICNKIFLNNTHMEKLKDVLSPSKQICFTSFLKAL